jgi:hypothetical protein
MLTAQDKGREFEKKIHNVLKKTKYLILSETEVKRKYGIDTTAIDHLFETNDYIYCFQDKLEKTAPSISKINHFIQCVNNISTRENKICIGVYLSKVPFSSSSSMAFTRNNNSSCNKYISISNIDEEHIIKDLIDYLYDKNIYLYNDDDTCLMLDPDNNIIYYL